MSITFIEYQPTGSLAFDPQSHIWRHEYTRNMQARTDSPLIGPKTIIAALGLTLGAHYVFRGEEDRISFLQAIEVQPDVSGTDDYTLWIVQLRYGFGNTDPSQWPEDPTQQPPDIRGGFVVFEEVCEEDINGDPILNTANDPFDPPIMRDRSRPVLSISDNVLPAAFDPLLAEEYADAVNSNSFVGADPGTVKVTAISYEYLFHPTIGWYWHRNFEFQYRRDGWTKVVLDAGLYQLDTDNITKVPILISGIPAQESQPLNGLGKPLPAATHATYGDAVNYLEFEIYEAKDFGALNLTRAENILMGTGS